MQFSLVIFPRISEVVGNAGFTFPTGNVEVLSETLGRLMAEPDSSSGNECKGPRQSV